MTDQDAVKAANDEYYRAYNARDFDAMEKIWAKNVPVACIHSSYPRLTNRDEVLKSYKVIFDVPNLPESIHQQDEFVVTGDTAMVTAYERWSGGQKIFASSKIFIREDGEWKLFIHHSSQVTQRVLRSGREKQKKNGNGS